MPLRPIWRGLLVNVAVYSTAWWLLWLAVTAPRRFIRQVSRFRSGCCIECGYDLGYDFMAGCPECGWRRERALERGSVRGVVETRAANGNGHS
jgi:hypothetical protein